MRTILPAIVFLLIACDSRAQSFEGVASAYVDSLQALWLKDTSLVRIHPDDSLFFIRTWDSLVTAGVTQRVDTITAKGHYGWPFWYFMDNGWSKPTRDTSIHSPTRTQRYLMEHQYGISDRYGVSNGCMWEHAFVIHDSLMAEAIRKRYGQDFFQRIYAEAAELDKKGRGLNLPFIRNPQSTAAILSREFARTDTLTNGHSTFTGSPSKSLLVVEFRGDSVVSAYWGHRSWGGINPGFGLFDPDEHLEQRIQKLGWTGPRFDGRPAEETVVFDFNTGELTFR